MRPYVGNSSSNPLIFLYVNSSVKIMRVYHNIKTMCAYIQLMCVFVCVCVGEPVPGPAGDVRVHSI